MFYTDKYFTISKLKKQMQLYLHKNIPNYYMREIYYILKRKNISSLSLIGTK